jgi:uncharacterized protein GlcG (DUF336 family)
MEITYNQTFKALTQAIDKANEIGVNANITILGSIDISMGKAKTAMLFRMNSELVGEFLAPEAHTYGLTQTSGGLVGFKGGMPVKENAEIVAYIGVSGGSPDQDFEIATAGSII